MTMTSHKPDRSPIPTWLNDTARKIFGAARWAIGLSVVGASMAAASAQVACRYEIADVIGVACDPVYPCISVIPTAISHNGRYVSANYDTDEYLGLVYDTQT